MMRNVFALIIVSISVLAACSNDPYVPERSNILRTDYDNVNQKSYVYSKKYYAGLNKKFYFQGKIIGKKEYLTVGYEADSWLFINKVTIRFKGSQQKYILNFRNPTRKVGYGGRISEEDSFRTTSGNARAFVAELKRRAKKGKTTNIYLRADGDDYYDEATFMVTGRNFSLAGFFIHSGDPKDGTNSL